MKKTNISNQVIAAIDHKDIENTINVLSETEKVLSMTPKDGYHKKIDLISNDETMSTEEKIKAIDAAEDKYASDLEKNAEVFTGMMWAKAGAILLCTAAVVLMVTTPEGGKIAKSVIKLVA